MYPEHSPASQDRVSDPRGALRAGFTTLFDVDLALVGLVAALGEAWTPLSSGAGGAAPPVARATPEGVLVDARGTRVLAHGAAIRQRLIPAAELATGVLLEVGRDTVVMVHLVPAPRRELPSFGLVGESTAMWRLREQIARAASLSVPVLLRGESGTGKELAARAIGAHGTRAGRPFVAVNLAGVPASIAASELFGHAPGAFTSAAGAHAGYFAQADGGTLFLDEIGATSLEVQAMLLRTLETQEIQPLGSTRARRVSVRVIAATDEDLEVAMRQGRFRAALYHRLAGYEIGLPPLRARREDVGRLLLHFLGRELEQLGAAWLLDHDRRGAWLSAQEVARLARADWPGNVRQLANTARQLAMAAVHGELLPEPAPPAPAPSLNPAAATPTSAAPAPAPLPAPRRRLSDVSEEEVLAVLRASRWHMVEAARRLGISRTSLYALVDGSPRIRKAKDISEAELRRSFEDCGGCLQSMAEGLEVSARGLQFRLRDLGLRG
jgi:two-component system nitrogen regulation response regulator GlnG